MRAYLYFYEKFKVHRKYMNCYISLVSRSDYSLSKFRHQQVAFY